MNPSRPRDAAVDAFRGLMALVMVQGHAFEALLTPVHRSDPGYQLQLILHGSTAPGFLFASGFVAALPRRPLSAHAAWRRARRLGFVFLTGYALQLPFFSLWKTLNEATPAQWRALFAVDALQLVAVAQLLLLGLQLAFPRRFPAAALAAAAALALAGPAVWHGRLAESWPAFVAPYLDMSTGSHFPLFPYAPFVLAGGAAGAWLGRSDARLRRAPLVRAGALGLVVGSGLAAFAFRRVDFWAAWDFWAISPAYTLMRLGGLLLLLAGLDAIVLRGWRGSRLLAAVGRETLLVYVLHLLLLFGGVLGAAPLARHAGQLGFGGAAFVFTALLPPLALAAWWWHRVKTTHPREAALVVAFGACWFAATFALNPW